MELEILQIVLKLLDDFAPENQLNLEGVIENYGSFDFHF